MKKYNILLMSAILVLLCSCGSTKNIAYLQNSDEIDFERSKFLYDAKIMPKDILTITVTTVNPEAATPFNMTVPNRFKHKTR